MNRRNFLSALAGLPIVGRYFKPEAATVDTGYKEIRHYTYVVENGTTCTLEASITTEWGDDLSGAILGAQRRIDQYEYSGEWESSEENIDEC